MAENASPNSLNSSSRVEKEFVVKPTEEVHRRTRKKKRKKRKNKEIEEKEKEYNATRLQTPSDDEQEKEKEYYATRLLYNETPSDDEQEKEKEYNDTRSSDDEQEKEREHNETPSDDEEENEKEYNATRLLYNETPSDDEEEKSERVLPSLDGKKKSKKRKTKHVEDKESTKAKEDKGTMFTPSEESERVLPSPNRVKTNKPPPFSKLWSDEDEISLLKGMIKFKKEKGRDVAKNMVEFHPFMLKSLVLQATRVQLREKVRKLRIKYEKSVESGNGSRTLHERNLFQLCEKIWTVNPKQATEQPNSSRTGQTEQHNQNIPEIGRPRRHNILEIGQPRHHNIIPVTALNVETLEALDERLRQDIELVLNSKACLHGTKWDDDLRTFDLRGQSFGLSLNLVTLVREKANLPELRESPELLEQEVIRAYLEAKIEHAQLLSNAYNSFIKAPPKKVVASSNKNGVAAKKKDESGDDSSSEEERSSKEEDRCDEA